MKSTSDVWFMAFLVSKGFKINQYSVIARGKIRADFNLTEDEWKSLKLEFQNSELVKFKGIIEQLKDLSFVLIISLGITYSTVYQSWVI